MHDEKDKKVYTLPELVEYGTVIKLTGAWSADWIDGGGGKNKGPGELMDAM